MIALSDRAFVVEWKELKRWSVNSLFEANWQWTEELIQPLSVTLRRKAIPIDRKKHDFSTLQLITLHFDGEMEARDLKGKTNFKGGLFFAEAGDVLYSKIDVRNGAIGIVPFDMSLVAVSSEYPVYQVQTDQALSEYIKLIFRSSHFRKTINGMISGASGRKRVQPSELENVEIPLPPLPVQEAIVAYWQRAQEEVQALQKCVAERENNISKIVLEPLGIQLRRVVELPKVFALEWKDLERWSVSYLARMLSGLNDAHTSCYPVYSLGQIAKVSYGIQKCPSNRPGQHARPYLRVANVQAGRLNLSEMKYFEVPDDEMETYRLIGGDLLVCEGNSADLVGRPAIWNNEIPDCVHQNHILKVRVERTLVLPEYLLEYMQTQPVRTYFRARAKFTTNLASINSNDLRELAVPLPPLDVQAEIVQTVKAARAEIARERERAETLLTKARADVEAMILGTLPPPEKMLADA